MINEKYKPSLKEIGYEVTRIIGRGLKDFGKGFGFVAITPMWVMVTPTVIRLGLDYEKSHSDWEEPNNLQKLGGFLGFIPGIAASVIPAFMALENDYRYLGIPLATNIISGTYELYRMARKNLEDNLEEERWNEIFKKIFRKFW